ncbi:MAG: archaemetzincin family Zn-dependent metalloprotease [Aquificaceae bacterium]|nr:archaemetzincin family Zn-dependent metalloprotease [Aquificaceae bacterium]
MLESKKFVYLIAFGLEKRLLLGVSKNIKEVFGFEVRTSHVETIPNFGYEPSRGQYRADTLLEYISRLYYPDMLKLVALFPFDLYHEGFNFVFGVAPLGGSHALVSTYRLYDGDERLYFERVCKEVNHELGHTFGLPHCKRQGCVMNFSNSLWEVDRKTRFPCERCKDVISTRFSQSNKPP